MGRRFFAVGTYAPSTPSPVTFSIARALLRIVGSQAKDGTWGGPDSLDQFITTCHCTMTLLAAGLSPTHHILAHPLQFLRQMDTERQTTFFYRAGPLLNIPGADEIVSQDIAHLARTQARAGGNPFYPAPFFLLKVLRFSRPPREDTNEFKKTLEWIISEFSHDACWMGRTSITSMGLALVADIQAVPHEIKMRCIEFLLDHFSGSSPSTRPQFYANAIDDAFTVYNLYERWDALEHLIPLRLWDAVARCARGLAGELDSYTVSPPPFGGAVESPEYGIAVLARALMAYESASSDTFESELSAAIATLRLEEVQSQLGGLVSLVSFWGPVNPHNGGYAFVLMPFSSQRTTEIYQDFVKTPLSAALGIECRRADDMYRSRAIMGDIWDSINGAKFIIADLTGRNPNVFYELGLAHVIGKEVILIAESMDDIPFDLRGIRTIIYGDSPSTWRRLSQEVIKYAEEIV